MKLPFLISVPHAGLSVPNEVVSLCQLSKYDILRDGDEGAKVVYSIENEVQVYCSTDIARAIVDVNRAHNDFSPDGVVKTHTCYNIEVYKIPLRNALVQQLLWHYYYPYHERLQESLRQVRLGIDCHTMAEYGPPIGPDAGRPRPWVCLSDGDGATFPADWMRSLFHRFEEQFGKNVAVNQPFHGGYIVRTYGRHVPFVQIELSRGPFMTNLEKRERVLRALQAFSRDIE